MRGIRDYNRKDNALPLTSGMSYSSRSSWRGAGNGVRKQTKRNDAHSLHDRSGMTGLVIPVPMKVKPIYTTTHSEVPHVAIEQPVRSNSPAPSSALEGSDVPKEGAGNQAHRIPCNAACAMAPSTGVGLKPEGSLKEGSMSSKTKTRSWLSILTHDIPVAIPATEESLSAPKEEALSTAEPPSPLSPKANAETPPILHVNIHAAAPCKPVGRLARRPIGDNSYYRSDADLERERAQRQAYRDWVAMNETAKKELVQSQEPSRESPSAISLKRVDPPVGVQLKTPLYLCPGDVTATTMFYRHIYGAVELVGEDYDVYVNSKRRWKGNQRAHSFRDGRWDLGVVLELYGCLLSHELLS